MSDGVAIFFGHPAGRADEALRAVRCGWEILRTLAAAREVVEREFGLRLDARLAVASGVAGDDADAAAPFGDVPRIAAELQAQGATDLVTVDATCGGRGFETLHAGRPQTPEQRHQKRTRSPEAAVRKRRSTARR